MNFVEKYPKMQSFRTAVVSLQKSLLPAKNVVSINSQRTYVRNFWAENNDYKGIHGHTRNLPKQYGYTRTKRNVSSPVLKDKESDFNKTVFSDGTRNS